MGPKSCRDPGPGPGPQLLGPGSMGPPGIHGPMDPWAHGSMGPWSIVPRTKYPYYINPIISPDYIPYFGSNLGPYIGPYLGPYRDALFSCPILHLFH